MRRALKPSESSTLRLPKSLALSSGAAALMPRTASPVVILAPTFDIVPFLSLFPPYVMYIIRPGYPRPQMGIKGNGVEF